VSRVKSITKKVLEKQDETRRPLLSACIALFVRDEVLCCLQKQGDGKAHDFQDQKKGTMKNFTLPCS
jgi:hypothetical protein